MKRLTETQTLLIILAVIVIFVFLLTSNGSRSTGVEEDRFVTRGPGVGLIEIVGPIYDSRKWCGQLDQFRLNNQVKSIVVRVESPGGGVAASQELYEAIRRAREVKPVIVSMGGVAASGGYYCSLGADTIMANPGTTTGSIGVLIELPMFHELMDKIGVDAELIKSGEFKASGSPFRELTERERKYFQGYVDDAYEQFIETVAQERGLDLRDVRSVADGRVFTGKQAQDLGLVDLLGDFHAALELASRLGGLEGEPKSLNLPVS